MLHAATTRLPPIAAVLVLAIGCAGSPLTIEPIPVASDPSAQIAGLQSEIDLARSEQVPALSPGWFAKAEASLRKARSTLVEGGPVQTILGSVATGRAQIEQARKFARISETTFPTVLKARQDARAAGATQLGQRYSAVENQFVKLTRAVEDDSLGWAQREAPSVEKSFRAVELQAIQETTGAKIESMIAEARAQGAEKLTPDLLTKTEAQYEALEAFIRDNRYASEEIGTRAKATLFQAKRLTAFAQAAQAMQGKSIEAILLGQEESLTPVADALALPDIRDQGFPERYRNVALMALDVKGNRDQLRTEVTDLSAKLVSLEGRSSVEREQIAELESQRRFDDRYSQVSAYFSPAEAEVYKQGSNLVIRMRSIEFPVGSAVLQPPSYSVLSKVQRSIRAFGDPRVTIEGHTDTSGTKELNDLLSQQRADAVAEYLVANNTLPRDRISAVGRGFSDPLASNNTAEGRAQNRRIDVIVDARQAYMTPAVSSAP